MKSFFFSSLMMVFLFFCIGCGNGNLQISGKVTYPDGSPMEKGTICFDDGKSCATAELKSDGTFRLGSLKANDGIPKGTYSVYFTGTRAPGTDPKSGKSGVIERIAPKFKSSTTSGLKYEVKGSDSKVDFTVEYPTPTGLKVTPLGSG